MKYMLTALLLLAGCTPREFTQDHQSEADAAVATSYAHFANQPPTPKPEPEPDPNPYFDDTAGYLETYNRSRDKRRPMLVIVGANWCPACVALHRDIPKYQQQGMFGEAENGVEIEVVFVDADTQKSQVDAIRAVTKPRRFALPYVALFWLENGQKRHEDRVGYLTRDAIRSLLQRIPKTPTPKENQ